MIEEARRRAYLNAMQIVTWLPSQVLPFAAPSSLAWDEPESTPPEPLVARLPVAPVAKRTEEPAPRPAPHPVADSPAEDVRRLLPKAPATALARAAEPAVAEVVESPRPELATPPRFALQLLRAGACLLLVELPTGEGFAGRDPGYLLLRDLLRAAGLPDSPRLEGEPILWPLLSGGSLDQGPQAAREFVQGFIDVRLEQSACRCLWLIGESAWRYAGSGDPVDGLARLELTGLGTAWSLPALDRLMEEPGLKAEVWRSMRDMMPLWKEQV